MKTSTISILHILLAFAASATDISSDKIDTFMTLPDWMPTSVDKEHTFGSASRTNASHRTSDDTLAAVESVFEAWHERAVFFSESDNPDAFRLWDVNKFGPYPSSVNDLSRLWVTNSSTNAVERELNEIVFVYRPKTNAEPSGIARRVADSRRLHEFDNVFAARPHINRLATSGNVLPIVYKGNAWGGTNRIMYIGSSWIGSDESPSSEAWTDNYPPASFDPGEHCIPFCGLMLNQMDPVLGGPTIFEYGLIHDIFSNMDTGFNAFRYNLTYSDYWGEHTEQRGKFVQWESDDFWETSCATQTVSDAILRRFPKTDFDYDERTGILTDPYEGLAFGLTNKTRRLIPDDAVYYKTTNHNELVYSQSSETFGNFANPKSITRGTSGDVSEVLRAGPNDFICYVDPYGSGGGQFVHAICELKAVELFPGETYDVEISMDSPAWQWIPEEYLEDTTGKYEIEIKNTTGYSGVYRELSETNIYEFVPASSGRLGLDIKVYEHALETTQVVKVMSTLSAETRLLSMLDTSYEIPVYTNGDAHLSCTGISHIYHNIIQEGDYDVPIKITDFFNSSGIAPIDPVELDEIEMPKVEGFSTEVFEEERSAPPSHGDRRICEAFSGTGFGVFPEFKPHTEPFEVVALTGAGLKKAIGDHGSTPDSLLITISTSDSAKLAFRMTCETSDGDAFIIGEHDDFDELSSGKLKCLFHFSGQFYAEHFRAKKQDAAFFSRAIVPVGPGPLASSSGRISESDVLFFDERLIRRSKWDVFGQDWQWRPSADAYGERELLPLDRRSDEYPHEDLRDEYFDAFPAIRVVSTPLNRGRQFAGIFSEHLSTFSDAVHSIVLSEMGVSGTELARDVLPNMFPLSRFFPDFTLDHCRVDQLFGWPFNTASFYIVGNEIHAGSASGPLVADGDAVLKVAYFAYPIAEFGNDVIPWYCAPAVIVHGESRPVIRTRWNWKSLKNH